MKTVAQLAVAFAPLFLAATFPFIRTIRTGRYVRYFFICWGSLVAWLFVFSVIVPLVAYQINKGFGAEVIEWVPDPPGVLAVLFIGWLPTAVLILIAALIRSSIQWLKQKSSPQ